MGKGQTDIALLWDLPSWLESMAAAI